MNTLRDFTRAAAFGAVLYGVLQATGPSTESAQQYNASVEVCADELGGAGRMVPAIPEDCKLYMGRYQSSNGQQWTDASGHEVYYLPSYDEFMSDTIITSEDESAIKSETQLEHVASGLCLSGIAFVALRRLGRTKNRRAPTRELPAPSWRSVYLPKPPGTQANEDSPEWPWVD